MNRKRATLLHACRVPGEAIARATLAAFALLIVVQCGEEPERASPAPEAPPTSNGSMGDVPLGEIAGGWRSNGNCQHYEGAELFAYIDGGADIYHEYGFVRATVQEFRNASNKTITLEIFEMADAKAAFGLYSYKRSHEGERLKLGNGGMLEGYYLNFWKGKNVVTLTGLDEDTETAAALRAIAAAVDARMAPGGEVPEIVGLLPAEGLIPDSVKYASGRLGLLHSQQALLRNILRCKEAVGGDYASGIRSFVLRFADESECQEGFASARAELASPDLCVADSGGGSEFGVRTTGGNLILVRLHGRHLIVVTGKEDETGARVMLERLAAAASATGAESPPTAPKPSR
ncbi:MAG: DUF6599 family protein [Planctomycetota bacterium]